MKIKAISLWEPWASLIATGAKTIETRSWPTKYRGKLLICAAKKRDKDSLDLVYLGSFGVGLSPLVKDLKDNVPLLNPDRLIKNLNFGKAVAIVNLIACHTTELMKEDEYPYIKNEIDFGDYTSGRYCWVFDRNNIMQITEPFEVRGSQGFFDVEIPDNISLKKVKITKEKTINAS